MLPNYTTRLSLLQLMSAILLGLVRLLALIEAMIGMLPLPLDPGGPPSTGFYSGQNADFHFRTAQMPVYTNRYSITCRVQSHGCR